jgi:enoyl-CoA hydratase
MTYTKLSYRVEDKIGIVTFTQPAKMNALSQDVFVELWDLISSIAEEKEVRALIFTGEGRAFVAGADINEMSKMDVMQAYERMVVAHRCFDGLESLKIPVIAAINGFALGGGCELAMACDIRIASKEAKFGQPEVNLGIIPCYGGTQRLPRLIGKGNAMKMIFTGNFIDSTEAYRIGLVQEVVDGSELMEVACAVAKEIINKGPVAIALAKDAINTGMSSDFKSALMYEKAIGSLLFATEDQKEGMNAFLEKREALFRNK